MDHLPSSLSYGKSQAMKLTASMAMPTTKYDSGEGLLGLTFAKANINPPTTIATRDNPVAIVPVKAVLRTLTAFSHGPPP
jgi:hypothetical protein